MSPQFLIAAGRALAGGAVLAGLALFTQLAQGQSLRMAGIQAGVAGFGYLALRFGVEGSIDTLAARK